jgi:hypothetical protein
MASIPCTSGAFEMTVLKSYPFPSKIGHCFFNAYQGKIANCVLESVAAQHIEAPISVNCTYPNDQKLELGTAPGEPLTINGERLTIKDV